MSCPDSRRCEIPITEDYFNRICNQDPKRRIYENCYHYNRRHGYLKRAMQWLQLLAVRQAYGKPRAPSEQEEPTGPL